MPSRVRNPCIARDAALRGRPVSHTSTRRRERPRISAALSPAGPAPTMITSYMTSSCHGSRGRLDVGTIPAFSVAAGGSTMLLTLLLTLATAQMGFDQTMTVHHFRLFADGGSIEVRTKGTKDTKDTKERVRMHLSHIAGMFADGDFEAPMLVHDTKDVPGIAVLTARRTAI